MVRPTAVSEQVLRPDRVTIGFCIPTTLEGYRRHLSEPALHEFAGMVSVREKVYGRAIVSPSLNAQAFVRELGATVARDVTVQRLGELLKDSSCDCLILFAHVTDTQLVEFYDGLTDIQTLIGRVPYDYTGVLDLCLCNARNVAVEIRRARPQIGPIKVVDTLVDYGFNLRLYCGLLKLLSEGDFTYLEAFTAVIQGMRTRLLEDSQKGFICRLFRK